MLDKKDIIDLLSSDDEDAGNSYKIQRRTQSSAVLHVQTKERKLVKQSKKNDDDEIIEIVPMVCGNSNDDRHLSRKNKKRKRALRLDNGNYDECKRWNYESNSSYTSSTATSSSATNIQGKHLINPYCHKTIPSRPSHSSDLPQFRLYRGDGDNGILSTGFTHFIENLPSTSNNGATRLATYLHASVIQNKNVIHEKKNGSNTAACRHLAHIQQKDKWSCGFRNLQILFCALLPNVPEHHPISSFLNTLDTSSASTTTSSSNTNNKEVIIPSIQQLQFFMEQAWQEGFDSEGRKHYNGKIVGKTGHDAKVGALEISTILTYLFVDTTVVQFIVCYESRSLLCEFVWAYFNREVSQSGDSNSNIGAGRGSLDFSSKILKHIQRKPSGSMLSLPHDFRRGQNTHKNSNASSIQDCSHHPLLPLYLQWEGHSVTCIGIEKIRNNKKPRQNNNHQQKEHEYNIIILDPGKQASNIKHHLKQMNNTTTTNTAMHPISKSSNNVKTNKRLVRIPSKELLKKDCQILFCDLKPVDDNTKKTRAFATKSNVITAAHDAVEKYVLLKRRRAFQKSVL